MSSLISLAGFNIAYEFPDGTSLFNNFHFSFGQQTYGLIGPNGVGKTTFLKLLSQDLEPTQGTLSIQGNFALLPQIIPQVVRKSNQNSEAQSDLKTVQDLLDIHKILKALKQIESGDTSPEHPKLPYLIETIGENWNLEDRIQRIFHSLGIGYLSLERPVLQLSGGELVKVHIAKVLLKSPDIVLLDEPTNNLDQNGRQALYDFIESWDKCLIVVSHDRALLSHVGSIVELSNKGLQFYGGNYDLYVEEREKEISALGQRITTAKQDLKKQKGDLVNSIERQQRRMNQGKKKAAEGGIPKIVSSGLKRKAQATLAKVKNVQESTLLEAQLTIRNLKDRIKKRNRIQIDMPEPTVHSKKELFEIKDFNFRYADSPTFLFSNSIHFHLVGPKRVRIRGSNGAGKSTLIKLLLQSRLDSKDHPLLGEIRGSIQLKSNRVEHLDQKMLILGDESTSLLDHFSKVTPHLSESERRIRLGRFLFTQESPLKIISTLSGGEKMRAALACTLFSLLPPELLILDEPTNNLDLDSIEQIESALSYYRGAILVISHDSDFVENIGVTEELVIPHRHSKGIHK